MTNYYVYYKLDPGRAGEVRTTVEKIFASIETAPGVKGRWMRRRDDPATYMEVYEGVRDESAFEALLEREAAPLALERRIERFVCA